MQNTNAISKSNLITKIALLILDFKICILIVILFCKLISLSFFINLKYLIFNKILIIFVEITIEQQYILCLKNLIKILDNINNYNTIESINFDK